MKKYTLFLFTLIFSLSLLGLKANFVSAYESGCNGIGPYSVTTGKRCDTNPTTPAECGPGDLFSYVTGKPCSGGTSPAQPPISYCAILDTFKNGSRGQDVKAFQTELNVQNANLKVDGSYGPLTRAAANRFCNPPNPNPLSPVISGVSGPQTLNVNQQGTWTVTASDPSGGNLSYSVRWGDDVYATPMMNSTSLPVQQSATFTHSYSTSRIYTPMFTVTNTAGQTAQTSLSVNVGNVVVDPPCCKPPYNSTISVLSPNGGETWQKGTVHAINWQDNSPMTGTCPANANCEPAIKYYDITLNSYHTPCTTNMCPMVAYMDQAPYMIAKNVSGYSYNWSIPSSMDNRTIYDGQYKIQICQTGTTVCDSSNSPFTINSGTASVEIPVIYSLAPTAGLVGTQVTVTGSGFTSTGNKLKFGNLGVENNPSYSLNSTDGKTLVFTVPTSNYFACWFTTPACYAPSVLVQPGIYPVSVTNANGTSNVVNFTVNNSGTSN